MWTSTILHTPSDVVVRVGHIPPHLEHGHVLTYSKGKTNLQTPVFQELRTLFLLLLLLRFSCFTFLIVLGATFAPVGIVGQHPPLLYTRFALSYVPSCVLSIAPQIISFLSIFWLPMADLLICVIWVSCSTPPLCRTRQLSRFSRSVLPTPPTIIIFFFATF